MNMREGVGFLDELSAGLTVKRAQAKQDLIQLRVRRWSYQGTLTEFGRFSERLSNPFEVDGIQRLIFSGEQHTPEQPIWPIVGGVGGIRYITSPGRPLFSGKLRGYSRSLSTTQQGNRLWDLTAELSLNPTRALIYERRLHTLSQMEQEMKLSVPATLFAGKHPHWNGILPLVRGDNVALGSERLRSQFHPDNWRINVERYWLGVLSLLDERLEQAAAETGGDLHSPAQRISLRTVETYWEFPDDNPIATVAALERTFRSVGARSSVQWSEITEAARRQLKSKGVELGNEDNSPVIKIFSNKHTMIKIYAKATDRIRLEVRLVKGSPKIGRYTCEAPSGLFGWIDRANEASETAVNSLLTSLRAVTLPYRGFQYSPQRLIFDISTALKVEINARHIVELLIRHGKLEKSPQGSLSPSIKKLLDAKIIRLVSRSGDITIYHVDEPYRQALAHLQAG